MEKGVIRVLLFVDDVRFGMIHPEVPPVRRTYA